jgi:AcrR family transcriptional regulator
VATTPAASAEAVPRRRGRPPRVSREEIVAAAISLFARRGYRGTTVAAIAEAVGVTDASVLHYFENKSAILDASLEDDGVATQELLAMLEPGGVETLRRLAGWGARMEANPETTRLQLVLSAEALMEGAELHERYVTRISYLRRNVSKAIQRGIDAGEIRADADALHEATALIAFLDGIRLQWFYTGGDLSLDEQCRAFFDDLLERIAVPARGARSVRRSRPSR